MKFCTQQQILNWVNVTSSKMKKLHWTDSEFDRTYYLFQYKSVLNCGSGILYVQLAWQSYGYAVEMAGSICLKL